MKASCIGTLFLVIILSSYAYPVSVGLSSDITLRNAHSVRANLTGKTMRVLPLGGALKSYIGLSIADIQIDRLNHRGIQEY